MNTIPFSESLPRHCVTGWHLPREPMFTAAAIPHAHPGISATTAIFSVVRRPDQAVALSGSPMSFSTCRTAPDGLRQARRHVASMLFTYRERPCVPIIGGCP